jgi:hypothetical protein
MGPRIHLFRDKQQRGAATVDSTLKLFPLSEGNPGGRPYERIAKLYAQAGRIESAKEILQLRERALDSLALRAGVPVTQRVLCEVVGESRPGFAVARRRREGPD